MPSKKRADYSGISSVFAPEQLSIAILAAGNRPRYGSVKGYLSLRALYPGCPLAVRAEGLNSCASASMLLCINLC